MANIKAYLDRYEDFEDILGDLLADAGTVERVADSSEPERQSVAIHIINADSVPASRIASLLTSLQLETPVPAHSVTRAIGPVVPDLVAEGVLAGDPQAYDLVAGQPRHVKDASIRASASFATYVPQLPLPADELVHLAVSNGVPQQVRAAVLNNPVGFARLSDDQASDVAHRTAAAAIEVRLPTLLALSQVGARPESILPHVPRLIDQLSADELTNLLATLAEPYNALGSSTSANPAVVPDACRNVLDKLKAANLLHSVEKVRSKPQLKVARYA